MAKRISVATGNGLEINSANQKLQVKKGNAINTDNGVSVNVDNETIKIEDDKLKAVGTAPDLTKGSGIQLTTTGTTTKIDVLTSNGLKIQDDPTLPNINSIQVKVGNGIDIDQHGNVAAKGGNGIGVGSSGISVNAGNGIVIGSNKVNINANFTIKDTPLGTDTSNMELYSDGKIKVIGGGGGGGIKYLYTDALFLTELNDEPIYIDYYFEDMDYQNGILEGEKAHFKFLNGNIISKLGNDFLDKYYFLYRHSFKLRNSGTGFANPHGLQFTCKIKLKYNNSAAYNIMQNISNTNWEASEILVGIKDYYFVAEGMIYDKWGYKDLSRATIEIEPIIVAPGWNNSGLTGKTTFRIQSIAEGSYIIAIPKEN